MPIWSKLFGGNKNHTTDTPEEIQQNIADGKAVMLDVRSREEWDAGHLKGAIFIPITDVKALPDDTKSVEGLPQDKIVYCH